MAYQSHHCSATLLCPSCISVSLLTSVALSVLLSDMHLCSLLLLHFSSCTQHASTHMNYTPQPHPTLLCSAFLYSLCTFCILHAQYLCMLFTTSLFYPTGCSLRLFLTPPWIYSRITSQLCSACISHVESSPDHHGNSPSSLAVLFPVSSSSVVVMLRFLSFSGSRDSSSSLSVTVSRLWHLWLLSPFLHVTTGGDQTPIQKALPDLGLVSASSFSRYDLGL
jgi:hypothetical protein